MNKLKIFLKNSKSGIAAVLAMVLTFTVVFGAMIAFSPNKASADDEIPVIPSNIGFAGETYSSSNKLKILEVVPTLANCELSYMADCGPVTLEKALAITDADKFISVMKAYVNRINNIDGGQGTCTVEIDLAKTDTNWQNLGTYLNGSGSNSEKMNAVKNADIRFCNTNGGKTEPYVYKTTSGTKVYTHNFLAYAIFGCYDMCDKLEVIYATPDQLVTEGDSIYNINNYKLIYFNVSHNVSFSQTLYNTYNNTSISTGTFDENHNISGNVTWNLYYNVMNNDQAVMFDRKSFNGNYKNNLDKLYALIFGIDRETFESKFMATKPADNSLFGVYEGDWGKFNTETFELFFKPTKNQTGEDGVKWADYPGEGTAVTWNSSMFYSASYNPYSPVYSSGNDTSYYTDSDGVKHTFVNIGRSTGADVIKNVFVENGDNILGNSLIPSSDKTKIDPNRTNTSNMELAILFGDRNNKVRNAYIIQYILGLFSSYNDVLKNIRVLEIEPANSFLFDNDSTSAAYILENYLDKSTALGITVDVTKTTMNGFIAMTQDVTNSYDLVILGDKTYYGTTADFLKFNNNGSATVGYISPFNSKITKLKLEDFKKVGGKVVETPLSGNDITTTAANKLIEYIKSGKPMAIAESIYDYSGTDTDNIYMLSSNNLLSKNVDLNNVIKISKAGEKKSTGKYLSLKSIPSVSVNSKFFATYSDGLVQPTTEDGTFIKVDGNRVYLNFNANNSMQIGSNRNNYKVSIYFDSDGNGLITDSDIRYNFNATTNNKGKVVMATNADTNERNDNLSISFPKSMRGYVAWKITVKTAYADDVVIIDNSKLATTEITGAVINTFNEKKDIDVLQVIPAEGKYDKNINYVTDKKVNLVLTSDKSDTKNYNQDFYKYFNDVKSVAGIDKVNIKVVTVDEFQGYTDDKGVKHSGVYNDLDDYKMVILGFADNYNKLDITSKDALDALEKYIEDGNSVLLSHDTIIYKAYSDGDNTNVKYDKEPDQGISFNLSSRFRAIFGLDRFNISKADSTYKGTELGNLAHGFSNLFILKYGTVSGGNITKDSDKYLMFSNMSEKDIDEYYTSKYTFDGESESTIGKLKVRATTVSESINKGQITDFPYKISNEIGDKVTGLASTHSQWYQLNLDATGPNNSYSSDDTVVWYALTSTGTDYYGLSGNDALNNYYIYSRNNITYTGSGHSVVNSEIELKLFVNTIIKALSSSGNPPTVVVTSAEKVTGLAYDYVQKVRYNDFNDGTGTSVIEFRVDDDELGTGSTIAIGTGSVYWDINKDGKYTQDLDIDLTNYVNGYGWTNVYPSRIYSIDLKDISDAGISYSYKEDEGKVTETTVTVTFKEALENQDLRIVINAKKGNKTGTSIVQCVLTDVFSMD